MIQIYYDKESAKFDWKERDLNNEDDPSCESCGCHDIQYHFTMKEGEGKEDCLICNHCKHIFEASLR